MQRRGQDSGGAVETDLARRGMRRIEQRPVGRIEQCFRHAVDDIARNRIVDDEHGMYADGFRRSRRAVVGGGDRFRGEPRFFRQQLLAALAVDRHQRGLAGSDEAAHQLDRCAADEEEGVDFAALEPARRDLRRIVADL